MGGYAAYVDIGSALTQFGFNRVQGSLYICPNEDMANLFAALMPLKAMPWFVPRVRDIRAFKVDQWSDCTRLVKGL